MTEELKLLAPSPYREGWDEANKNNSNSSVIVRNNVRGKLVNHLGDCLPSGRQAWFDSLRQP